MPARPAHRRTWILKLSIGFAVAALLLLGVEGVAHLALGPPPPYDQVVRVSACQLDTAADRWTFDCPAQRVHREGALARDGRPRVVFLGGSSMVVPWDAAVPDLVGRLLPGVEVVSLAAPGLAVAQLAVLASRMAPLAPDLVVVYAGHNDYSQDVFRGRVQATRLALLPVYGLLARSWIHGALARSPRGTARHARQGIGTTDRTALDLAPAIRDRLREDLETLVAAAPAPVLLSTLLRNPDGPPTGVLADGDSACVRQLAEIIALPPGPRGVARARSLCPDTSILAWVEARAHRHEGDLPAARAAFARSLRLDPLPLRAPLEADDVIRDVARRRGDRLLDLEAAVGPFPEGDWFVDAIHLSEPGAAAVAAIFAPQIQGALEGGS